MTIEKIIFQIKITKNVSIVNVNNNNNVRRIM